MAKKARRLILIRPGFLVLTAKGLEFVETWFGASGRVPPHLTKLYQLLLQTVSMGGVISLQVALKMGYSRKVIREATSRGYVELTSISRRPEKGVLRRIKEMVGQPPKEIYI